MLRSEPNLNLLRCGVISEAEKPLELHTGVLSASFSEGMLRYVKVGNSELIRGVYAAVRDHNWDTIPAKLIMLEQSLTAESFRLVFESHHKQGDSDFRWIGTLVGERNTLKFTMQGEALSSFKRNRIGFCVLHPMDCAGLPCLVEHVDGSVSESMFPKLISPHQPFFSIRAITHRLNSHLSCEVRMEGDSFEMEDQRNWTDASYKTYCTPLGLAFPVVIEKGTKLYQSVSISVHAAVSEPKPKQEAITLRLKPDIKPLPAMGLAVASHGGMLTDKEVERLRLLRLAHLRLDVRLYEQGWQQKLEQAKHEANLLGTKLELAVWLSDHAEEELQAFKTLLVSLEVKVARYLVFHAEAISTPAYYLDLAKNHLQDAPIAAGTDAFFTELNRNRPPQDADLIVYSINPQVHAFDNASLVETLAAQAVTVATARSFSKAPICISPITLRMRWNPNATGEEAPTAPNTLPKQVDTRQLSLLGAAWTLGSLKYLAEIGAASLSYFETTGWLGVMEREAGSALPEKFPSLAASVFPLYHVFADLAAFTEVQTMISSQPLAVTALMLKHQGASSLIIANFTAQEQTVVADALEGNWKMRVLDESNVRYAMQNPEAYRLEFNELSLESSLSLPPYALVRLDA